LILKFDLYLPKEYKQSKLCQGAKETSLDLLSTCLLVMEFLFDAMLMCSNLGNENSDGSHTKCPRGPRVPHPWIELARASLTNRGRAVLLFQFQSSKSQIKLTTMSIEKNPSTAKDQKLRSYQSMYFSY